MNIFEKIETYPEDTIFHLVYKKFQFIKRFFFFSNKLKLIYIFIKKNSCFSFIAYKIIKSQFFENLTLLVIILNSVVLALDDPTSNTDNNP